MQLLENRTPAAAGRTLGGYPMGFQLGAALKTLKLGTGGVSAPLSLALEGALSHLPGMQGNAGAAMGMIHGDRAPDVLAAAAGALGSASAPAAAEAAGAEAVGAYEVGTFDELRARSTVGDKLDLHHVGQAHAMEQIVPGYNRATGPAIALPASEHRAISTLRGPVDMSPRSLLARDIWNLRANTNAPNSALIKLIKLNKAMYPEAFAP